MKCALLLGVLAAGASALHVPSMPAARVGSRSGRSAVMEYGRTVKLSAEEAAKKNPTAADRPAMAAKYAGVRASDRDTKKNTRNKIMKKKSYKRSSNPFDLSIHQDVSQKMSEMFAGDLVNKMKEDTFRELVMGEGDRKLTFVLAKEFGFCWGVERSIELAWAAREAFPDKTMHITNELIHNPGVNDLLRGKDIKFMEKDADAVGGKRFDAVGEGDVVILPAFGASLEEMQLLDDKGVTTVDTTCPWVSKVWTTVDKHQLAEMTSLIHGKYQHEEAIATASMCETYLIIKNMKEATEIASYILQEPGCLTDEELLAKYKHAASAHFDPRKHLKKLGLANQTTMYKKETQAIGKLFEKTMVRRRLMMIDADDDDDDDDDADDDDGKLFEKTMVRRRLMMVIDADDDDDDDDDDGNDGDGNDGEALPRRLCAYPSRIAPGAAWPVLPDPARLPSSADEPRAARRSLPARRWSPTGQRM